MKNKGRKHKYPTIERRTGFQFSGICNLKSMIPYLTRQIESMSSKGFGKGRFDKKKWSKRVRGYFKSQTKAINE